MSFSLYFVKSRIYFGLLVFSTHTFMCLLSVSGIYRLIQSRLLSTLAIDMLGSKDLGSKCIRTSICNVGKP